jgi:hypothetical protein
MPARLAFVALIGVVVSCTAFAGEPPSIQQVQEWWKAKSTEEMAIDDPLQEVHLVDKEVAFMAPAYFFQRGRNFFRRAVLIRPDLKEVRELPYPVGFDFSVQDLDGDGVSEVLSVSTESGEGDNYSVHAIFRLDGFNPVLLHEAVTEDNLGWCYRGCEKVDVAWKFGHSRPPNSDETLLTETITTSRSPQDPARLKSRSETRRYVLIGNVFVRADAERLRADFQP